MDSANSDLLSRIHRNSIDVWSSATTINYKEIQKRPPWEQVVLQQYEYGLAINANLHDYAKDKFNEHYN